MKKTFVLIAFALSLLGSAVVHADPPGPTCPPICNTGGNGGNGN